MDITSLKNQRESGKLTREEAKKFLRDIAHNYRTFSGFENWARDYSGPNKAYLSKVIEHIGNLNSGGSSRIFGLSPSEIESIVNSTIPLFK